MSFDRASSQLFTSNTRANKNTPFYGNDPDKPPNTAPSVPVFLTSTSSTISVQFNVAGITGGAPLSYSLKWGPAGGPYNNTVTAGLFAGTIYFATFGGLLPSTNYQCEAVVSNGLGSQTSAVSAIMTTGGSVPTPPNFAPSIPETAQSTIPPTSIVVFFNDAGVTGTPEPTYSILYGTTTNPTTSVPALLAFGSLRVSVITGLTPSTAYYFKSVATNGSGSVSSAVSPPFTTSAGTGTAPSGPPTVPVVSGTPTQNSITVTFDAAGITGTPTPTYNLLFGPTGSPTLPLTATLQSGTIYQGTATGLSPSTSYYFKSVATNGVSPDGISAVSAAISTANVAPTSFLSTICAMPFLIQGPRFGDNPGSGGNWAGLDYQLSGNAIGTSYVIGQPNSSNPVGNQSYGNMYAGSVGNPGTLVAGGSVPYAGACAADVPFTPNYQSQSETYLAKVRQNLADTSETSKGLILVSIGGYLADVLGLFGPYVPSKFPVGATPPTAQQVAQSFVNLFCGINTSPNPLNWVRQNSNGSSFWPSSFFPDGIILDFENIGMGNYINNYPYPRQDDPGFPAQATNPTYAPYINILGNFPLQLYTESPDIFIGNAPASLSIVQDEGQTNICACNTALNTWYPFPTATVAPTVATYNATSSMALNHPVQLSYMDDIFVQFYNESSDYYPGGQFFPNLLACWGWVALEAQKLGRKKTTINLGLAKGTIISGPNSIAGVITDKIQGPTPPASELTGHGYDLWYPQYCTSEPPNSVTPSTSVLYWPNTGPSKDPLNIANDIKAAHAILQSMTGNSYLLISDWLSGMGFWAGGDAVKMAHNIYDSTNVFSPVNAAGGDTSVLPHKYVYCWGDASYPAPANSWDVAGGNNGLPIKANW